MKNYDTGPIPSGPMGYNNEMDMDGHFSKQPTRPSISILGLGRIGRMLVRICASGHHNVSLVGIYDKAFGIKRAIDLLEYDTVYGPASVPMAISKPGWMTLGCQNAQYAPVPADLIIDATGSGACLSTPDIPSIVTDDLLRSRASLHPRAFHVGTCDGVAHVSLFRALSQCTALETIHASVAHPYMCSQSLLDHHTGDESDPDSIVCGRAAARNLIPKPTSLTGIIRREMNGIVDPDAITSSCIRTPHDAVCVSSIHVTYSQQPSSDMVWDLFSANGYAISDRALVSSQCLGAPVRGTILTRRSSIGRRSAQFVLMYDNEAGYAHVCMNAIGKLTALNPPQARSFRAG